MFWYLQTTCHMIMKIIFQFLAKRSQVGLQEYEPEEFQRQHNAQAWSCVLQRDVSIFYRTYTMPTKQSIPLQRIPNILIIPLHTMSTILSISLYSMTTVLQHTFTNNVNNTQHTFTYTAYYRYFVKQSGTNDMQMFLKSLTQVCSKCYFYRKMYFVLPYKIHLIRRIEFGRLKFTLWSF